MSRCHPASLVPIKSHDPRLLQLVGSKIIPTELVKQVAELSISIVGFSKYNRARIQMLHFICHILRVSHMPISTLLTSLIYLQRMKERLGTSNAGSSTAHFRVFLAAFVIAAKYTNDSSPKNSHWSKATKRFDTDDVTCMERQLLFILNFDLAFTEAEALGRWSPFLPTESPEMIRLSAVSKVSAASKLRAEAQARASLAAVSPSTTVGELTECMSSTYLRPPLASYPSSMSSSSSSDSFSGSEHGGLTDDNGSSSGSSTCPSSSEEDSESEAEKDTIHPPTYASRPTPNSLGYQRPSRVASRSRMPSDTSSICTVTSKPSLHRRTSVNGRHASAIYVPAPENKDNRAAGGFLSRMWGAATGNTGKVVMDNNVAIVDPEAHQSSSFRRLVHTRSSIFRASVAAVMDI